MGDVSNGGDWVKGTEGCYYFCNYLYSRIYNYLKINFLKKKICKCTDRSSFLPEAHPAPGVEEAGAAFTSPLPSQFHIQQHPQVLPIKLLQFPSENRTGQLKERCWHIYKCVHLPFWRTGRACVCTHTYTQNLTLGLTVPQWQLFFKGSWMSPTGQNSFIILGPTVLVFQKFLVPNLPISDE